jgi:glycosyltransferase involved in cell wall biosynthesis
MRFAIGIHLQSEPDRLSATLAHLRAATPPSVDILLLADGPDAATRQMLETCRDLPQSTTDQSLGAAACFNRLLRHSDAELVIFLEAGALVGAGWLEGLLAALQADTRNGLAGPSTNRSWNVQAAFPDARETDINRTAALAVARFGIAWQPLEPLYCLADFCYAVRRDVVEAIGGADEAYGAGPCWEMDYTVRAARAGFRAVWAKSSFVYRRPFTLRREQNETRLFEASKRRYQDKFCGLRLSGGRTTYAKHCRGDACRHFAPVDGITLRHPINGPAASAEAAQPCAIVRPPLADQAAGEPLVSCIMPTRNRRDWLLQAIAYFQRQDYPERELIIIDDSDVDCSDDVPSDPEIRYVHSKKRLSIGAKRNQAVELAHGTIIVHWDDDDWYAADRLSAQVTPLLAGTADITALTHPQIFDLDLWEFWTCTAELHRRLFVRDVHGGTLAYRREVFERLARYPDSSLAEDAAYLNAAVARGARLQAIPADGLFLYVRHGGNAWAFTCGQYLDARGWRRIEEPEILAPDRGFYAGRSGAAAARCSFDGPLGNKAAASNGRAATAASAPRMPLVSCIMPTYNRRLFVPKAIEYFQRQDYPNRELIILDDGDDRVADLVPDLPSVRYIGLPERLRLGAKRNAAIEASRGEIIVHWDDDDWMDRGRISSQISALLAADADICGTSKVWFCEIASGRLSVYQYPPTQRRWVYGASLCYRRSLWQQKPFEPLDIGEDTRFVWAAPAGRVLDLDGSRVMVAIVHSRNTSNPRPLFGPNWSAWSSGGARDVLGEDWLFYESLGRQ